MCLFYLVLLSHGGHGGIARLGGIRRDDETTGGRLGRWELTRRRERTGQRARRARRDDETTVFVDGNHLVLVLFFSRFLASSIISWPLVGARSW